MDVRKEIDKCSIEADKPVLHWLFNKYHMESQWRFVARCSFKRFGPLSYQTNRVWQPTAEGRALHAHMGKESPQ